MSCLHHLRFCGVSYRNDGAFSLRRLGEDATSQSGSLKICSIPAQQTFLLSIPKFESSSTIFFKREYSPRYPGPGKTRFQRTGSKSVFPETSKIISV